MNDLLQLKGAFQQRPHSSKPGPRNIPPKAHKITSKKLKSLLSELRELKDYWTKQSVIDGCLIDVCYIDVIAKSNRISGFLSSGGSSVNESVVGARFAEEEQRKHIITHYVGDAVVGNTIKNIQACIKLLDENFSGHITYDNIDKLKERDIDYERYGIPKTTFVNIIVDTHYVKGFKIPENSANTAYQSIITIYKTNKDIRALMSEIGIHVDQGKILSPTTLLLYPNEIKLLLQKAPYLIAMATEDLTKLSLEDVVSSESKSVMKIDPPNGEPVIGVIDTLFDERVYFSEWVEFKKMISDEIPIEPKDFDHGTSVSSIIVDGPSINPDLDDGCGRFRVRHFGVAAQGQYSAFSIMKNIEEIVISNPDIKVWNLSLGADREVNKNFISPEASALDRIQYENDVIFVIAGTNKRDNDTSSEKRVGPPADSINSIVVNSTNKDGKPASYSRKGPILSFFTKPDVSFFGGDKDDFIRVCTPTGESFCSGTSYAAPWVTRKVAYLIEVLGFSREVAKALIVDAAAEWHNTASDFQVASLVGFGVVPKNINSVIQVADDEIKFVINGTAEKWDTYTYNLPIPRHNEAHPFVAKATLCYFPKCSINQGVDYTDTELDVYFGRIDDNGKIKSINNNIQSPDDGEKHYVYEGRAREFYRKWDNVKHIKKVFTEKVRALKAYKDGLWGLSIKTKDRLVRRSNGVNFGLVITLKEINGVNRINDFIHQCELRGWLVNRIDINSRVEIYNRAQETIKFD